MSESVIRLRDVRRCYDEVVAVAGISLDVARGEVVALLGPNGAGKTTTVEILEGLRQWDSGDVVVLGEDPSCGDARWRSRIGAVLQVSAAVPELTVQELLTAQAACYPSRLPVTSVLAACELEELADRRVKRLSGGQRRRLDIALAIIGDPELLFLDEPTTGLDPQVRRRIWELVQWLRRRGSTVLLTTHHLEEAETLADRVVVLQHGQIIADGTPIGLVASAARPTTIRFRRAGSHLERLPALDGAHVLEARDFVTISTDRPTAVLDTLFSWAARSGEGELPGLSVSSPNLEDVYLGLVAEQ